MPDVHAKLSASGAKKWLNCPASVELESQFPDTTSTYAAEGTTAHSLGEFKLRLAQKEITKAKYHKAVKLLQVDNEMERYTDGYRDFVLERLNAHKSRDKTASLWLEQRLDFSKYVPEGFGTGDATIISAGGIEVIDLKYGKGVTVSAEDNPQLKLYALGALDHFDFLGYAPDEVTMTIYQPRTDNISTETVTVHQVLDWGSTFVAPRALQAAAGGGDCVVGKHCDDGFCKARATCRAYAEDKLKLAAFDFAAAKELNVDEISEVIEQAELLAKWSKMVKEYALDQAINHGVEYPGYKVVEGRSNRILGMDPKQVILQLTEQGLSDDQIYKKDLRSVPDFEKTLTALEFETYIKDLVIKPPGKPTLVHVTDKRPELQSTSSAQTDFANIEV